MFNEILLKGTKGNGSGYSLAGYQDFKKFAAAYRL